MAAEPSNDGTSNYLHVVHYPVFGGPHNQALRLAAPLRAAGWETIAVLPDDPGNAAAKLRAGKVEVRTIPLSRLRASANPLKLLGHLRQMRHDIRRLRAVIRETEAQLVVIGGLANPQAAIAARREGVPVVWQLVDTRLPRPMRAAMMPLVRFLAAVVMCTGSAVARAHPGAGRFGERLVTFYPPVDTDQFAADPAERAAARAELSLGDSDLIIGTIGNLNPMKGHQTLVLAAARLRELNEDASFVILGAAYDDRPGYGDELLALASELGIPEGRLQIVDPGARVSTLANAFDIFWLTSKPNSEGIPTVVGEAMSLGLPVVAANVGSVAEAITDGETGLLVTSGAVPAFAARTQELIEDPTRRATLGARAREACLRSYAIDVCLQSHLRAFALAVDRRPA